MTDSHPNKNNQTTVASPLGRLDFILPPHGPHISEAFVIFFLALWLWRF